MFSLSYVRWRFSVVSIEYKRDGIYRYLVTYENGDKEQFTTYRLCVKAKVPYLTFKKRRQRGKNLYEAFMVLPKNRKTKKYAQGVITSHNFKKGKLLQNTLK